MDKILSEHPIAAWTLDEDFAADGPFENMDSFFSTPASVVIPLGNVTNSGGFATISTTGAHGLIIGDNVLISTVVPSGYRGRYQIIDVPTTTSFKIQTSTTGNVTGAGTLVEKYNGYKLDSYNTERFPGYVLSNKALSSKVPMVYGSPKSQNGSFLIPSFGFLSKSGAYNQYTFETWVKIKRTNTSNKFKLIGLFRETASTDDGNGLYYNDTSFILKIGNKSDTAYIKEMNKPLLIHIVYSESSVQLFVNGELLINLILEEADLALLSNPANLKNYICLQSATFDCPAIYPYRLSPEQTKMHYVYGQAVIVPEKINKVYGGKTISIDFPSAGYSANMNYPTNSQWKNSISNNLNIQDYSISNKKFDLPTFNFYDTGTSPGIPKTSADFITAIGGNTWQPKFGTFSTVNSNVEFKKLNVLDDKIAGFYIDYTLVGTASTDETTIFKVLDKTTSSTFRISMQLISGNVKINYKFNYNSSQEVTISSAEQSTTSSSGARFLVGISIKDFAENYESRISNFFNNPDNLTMFVLGDNDTTLPTTPNVIVNSINILNSFEVNRRPLLTSNGRFFCPTDVLTPGTPSANQNQLISSYKLIYVQNKQTYNTSYTYSSTPSVENYFSVGTSGYWKDDVPLIHFAKTVKDGSENDVYTFNLLQFNLDYDYPSANTTGTKYFDSSGSNVKSYVTFESVLSTYKSDTYFTNGIQKLGIERTVRPDSNWETTKYEVVDGTVLYLPPSVNPETLSLVIHIDISVSDIKNNEVEIKSLEITSQALSLNSQTQNPISTKFGNNVIPYTYTQVGGGSKTYDYSGLGNARNPFIIEKKTSPHLKLEKLSGIRLVGFDSNPANTYRGIRIPINNAKVSAMQMFVYYDATIDPTQSNRESFQFDSKEVFNILTSDRTLTGTLTNTSGVSGTYNNTATLSISSTVGPLNENIKYYINGNLVATPTITTNEWVVLGIEFTVPQVFTGGAEQGFNITGPLAYDNISYYNFSDKEYLENPLKMPIGLDKIYGMYVGTNILYAGQDNHTQRTVIKDVQYSFYNGYTASRIRYTPQ